MTTQSSLYADMDEDTVEALIRLHLADLEDIEARGKQRDDHTTDNRVAMALMRETLQNMSRCLADRRMAQSMAAAVHLDGNTIWSHIETEQVACRDRSFAHGLDTSHCDIVDIPADEIGSDVLSRLAGLYVSRSVGSQLLVSSSHHGLDDAADQAESSSWVTRSGPDRGVPTRSCVACQDDKDYLEVMPAPCGHEYCRGCLQDLFTSSFSDESLFPPRCCRRAILPDQVSVFLTGAIRRQYTEKHIEFGTSNRTYCSRPSCSIFIRPADVDNDVATCAVCLSQTCTVCKMPAHGESECPNDPALQAVNDLARQHGWQRCFSCRRFVELEVGCNHMTCVCRAEFCYRCGLQWKTCSCPQWDEHRLIARANQIVDRDRGPPLAIDNPLRLNQVQQATEMLRDRHNCGHDHWAYTRGQHQCEECLDILPQYIYECRRCRLRACNRCRRNRL